MYYIPAVDVTFGFLEEILKIVFASYKKQEYAVSTVLE